MSWVKTSEKKELRIFHAEIGHLISVGFSRKKAPHSQNFDNNGHIADYGKKLPGMYMYVIFFSLIY